MKSGKTSIFVCLVSAVIGCSSCSDNGILFRSVGSYDKATTDRSFYLIGKPYEVDGVTYTPAENYDYFDSGDAFWFTVDPDHPFTANGERNDGTRFTAMHRTLPLPSVVRITNLNNHASVLVRVNDRGPYDNARLIDVSEPVAKYLNFYAESHLKKRKICQADCYFPPDGYCLTRERVSLGSSGWVTASRWGAGIQSGSVQSPNLTVWTTVSRSSHWVWGMPGVVRAKSPASSSRNRGASFADSTKTTRPRCTSTSSRSRLWA